MNKFNVDDLVEQGLVKKKVYTEGEYKGLSVLKYTRKVFFKNLWHLDERLLSCRGTVVDEDDNIISLPFDKVFNYTENNTFIDLDKEVTAVRKINGFLGVCTKYKGDLLVSTTGTLDSDYANLARHWIMKGNNTHLMAKGFTYIFEICDREDPHIVQEEEGAWLIGFRYNEIGSKLYNEEGLDTIANSFNYKRPEYEVVRFSEVLKELKTCKHEGYMVRDIEDEEVLCKIKSGHYLSLKCMMRLGKNQINMMYNNKEAFRQRLDEEFYEILDHIVSTVDISIWSSYNEQQRRKFIEDYFYDD